MMLPRNLRFIRCAFDDDLYSNSYLSVVETFSRHVLNKGSYINGSEGVMEAAEVLLNKMDGTAARPKKMIW